MYLIFFLKYIKKNFYYYLWYRMDLNVEKFDMYKVLFKKKNYRQNDPDRPYIPDQLISFDD